MRGYRRSSGSAGRRAVWRYGWLGLAIVLAVIFSVIAIGRGGSPSTIAVGKNPLAIAITPDGTTAYVVNMSGNTITPVSLNTGGAGSRIPVNGDTGTSLGGPDAIAITPDGATAYVADPPTNTLVPVDLATGTTGKPIPIAGGPGDIAIAPDGKTAYVGAGDNAVVPVSLSTGTTGKPIPVSMHAGAIAIAPEGATAYVTSFRQGDAGQPRHRHLGQAHPGRRRAE
jgi:DNA-binding beta-propeller fold protein YncE